MNTPKHPGGMGRLGLSFLLAFSVCLSAAPVLGQGSGQGSSKVEQEEEEYLKGIVRPEEKIERDWGKSSPRGRGGQKSFDGPDPDRESRSVEDPEAIKLYDGLTSTDRLAIKKSVLHESNIHVTRQFEKQTARLKGKVPYEDWDLYLNFKPSPAARSNEILKNWEKKRWEELIAQNKQEQFRKSLLAGFDKDLVQVLSQPKPGAERTGRQVTAGTGSRQTAAAKSAKSGQARSRTDSPARTAGAVSGSAGRGTPGTPQSAAKTAAGRQAGVARKSSGKGTAAQGTAAAGGAKPSRVGARQGAAPSAGTPGQGKGTAAGAGERTASSQPTGAPSSGSSGAPSAFEQVMRQALKGFEAAQSAPPGGSAKPDGSATAETATAAGKAPGTRVAPATAQSRTAAQPKTAGTGTAAKGVAGAKAKAESQSKTARAANTAVQRPGTSGTPSAASASGAGRTASPGRKGPATAPGGGGSGGASVASAPASPPETSASVAAAATGDGGRESGPATGSAGAGKTAGTASAARAMSGSEPRSSTGTTGTAGTMETADASAGSSPASGTASPAARAGQPAGATGATDAPGAASGQAADSFAARFGFGEELAMLSELGATPPSPGEPATAGDSAGDGMESASGADAAAMANVPAGGTESGAGGTESGAGGTEPGAGGTEPGEAGGNEQPADGAGAPPPPPAAPGAEMQAAAQSDSAGFDRSESQTREQAGTDDARMQQMASLTDPAGEAGGTDTGRPITGLLPGQKPDDVVHPSPPRLSQDQLVEGKRLLDRIDRGEMKPGELEPAQKKTLRGTLALIEKSDAGSVSEMRARADRRAQVAKEISEDRAKLGKELAGELAGPVAKTIVSASNDIAALGNPQSRPQPDQQELQRGTTGQAGLSAIGAGQNIYTHYRAVQSGDTNGASISGVNAARDLGDPGRAYSEASRAAGMHKVYQGYTGWREANRLSTVTSGSLNTMDRLARRAEAGARIDREIADLAERAQREPGILERLRQYLRDIDVP